MELFEALGDILAPHQILIAKIASTVTTMQFLSAFFLLNDVRKRADVHAPDPFIGGCVLTILSYKLGLLMDDPAMIRTNLIGIAINFVFVSAYYAFASARRRGEFWSKLVKGAIFTGICMAYPYFESPEKIEFRFGMIITLILVALVGAPLLNLGTIIKNRSTEGLPFPLILSGSVVALCWAIYGIAIKNSVVTLQNLFLLSLSSIQLFLFVIYPNSSDAQSSKLKAAKGASQKKKKN